MKMFCEYEAIPFTLISKHSLEDLTWAPELVKYLNWMTIPASRVQATMIGVRFQPPEFTLLWLVEDPSSNYCDWLTISASWVQTTVIGGRSQPPEFRLLWLDDDPSSDHFDWLTISASRVHTTVFAHSPPGSAIIRSCFAFWWQHVHSSQLF